MDDNAAREWLTWLYGEKLDGLIWVGGHANWRGGRFADIDQAVAYAAALDAENARRDQPWGVYHRLTTVGEASAPGTPGRGVDEDSIMLPALMMDIDLAGPGHKPAKLPRPEERGQVEQVFELAGVPEPTTWIESGGGLYPVWRLDSPLNVGMGGQALALAQESLRALQRRVISQAAAMGWKIDNTSDLARVYRLPGTTNRKVAGRHVAARWAREQGDGFVGGYALSELMPTPPVTRHDVNAGVASIAASSPSSSLFGGTEGFVPVETRESLEGFGHSGQSSLFGGGGASARADDSRSFTLAEAMAFVAPALDALRSAQDGEINVRLNEAALMLAHFGAEFWTADAADRQLFEALGATEYDGRTWRAEDTIASARRAGAGSWRARLVTPVTAETFEAAATAAETDSPDAVDLLLAEMLQPGEIISRPAPRYLVHGLLQFDSESWIIGPPGSKKSFVVLDIAARVARGEAWQGRRTNPADVVMIVAEGAGGAGKRLKAWEKRNGAIGEGRMYILPRPVQAGNPAAWGVLVAACARLAAAAGQKGRGLMVVLDTQARVTVGLKENDATDMGVYVGAVSAIRAATNACVISVHHTGRAGGDARGSSAIDGAQTTELKVMPGKSKLTATLSVEKQKDIEEIESMKLGFEIVNVGVDEDGTALTSLVLADQDSIAFREAWGDAEAGQNEQGSEAPLKDRVALDEWIESRGHYNAKLQKWIVQVLVDTAETLGLTESKVKKILDERQPKPTDSTTFGRAWQKVTEEGGAWEGIVVRAGGERWTVDRVAISAITGR